MPGDLPIGYGDERRLTQVLLNIVGNAIKFTDTGSVEVRVDATEGYFKIAVEDTGPGIPLADQQRVFDDFQQVDSGITRQKGGTGLGLSISRRLVQAHGGHSFRFWRNARREAELREPAEAALAQVGLAQRAATLVAVLSHGERRQLEIAMALAAQPRMLLLDEPMAGMGPEESARLVAKLRDLKGAITVILIEHDIDAVFALADRISVLVYGRIIASGDPGTIRADAGVRQAYLGEGATDD